MPNVAALTNPLTECVGEAKVVVPSYTLVWALAVALPSLVFGHLRERFSSVLPAILMHVTYNAGFALTAWWAHR